MAFSSAAVGPAASTRAKTTKRRLSDIMRHPLLASEALRTRSSDGRDRASGVPAVSGVLGVLNRRRHNPLTLALHALSAGHLPFTGGIERSVVRLDPTLSLVMADDQAIRSDAGPTQPEGMRRRAVGEQLFAAAQHGRHHEEADGVDQVLG